MIISAYEKKRSKNNILTFLRSPPIRRLIFFLLFLAVLLLTYWMGVLSQIGPARIPLKTEDFHGQVSRSVQNEGFATWAIALKTGRDVALKRTPIQLITFLGSPLTLLTLASVKNVIMIGDAPNVFVADVPMTDVVTGLKPSEHEGLGLFSLY